MYVYMYAIYKNIYFNIYIYISMESLPDMDDKHFQACPASKVGL